MKRRAWLRGSGIVFWVGLGRKALLFYKDVLLSFLERTVEVPTEVTGSNLRPLISLLCPLRKTPLSTGRVFDITNVCPHRKTQGKVFAIFSSDGTVVQFYYNQGMRKHTFLSDMSVDRYTEGSDFLSVASLLNLSPANLEGLVVSLKKSR